MSNTDASGATTRGATDGIETILLAIRGDESLRRFDLYETALEVAAPTDARVVVAHVFDNESFEEAAAALNYAEDVRPTPDELAGRVTYVNDLASRLARDGVDTEVRGLRGDGGKGIVAIAEEVEADRVLVSGRQRSPVGKAVFGSTAQEVMMNAPCPVTFVRGDENP